MPVLQTSSSVSNQAWLSLSTPSYILSTQGRAGRLGRTGLGAGCVSNLLSDVCQCHCLACCFCACLCMHCAAPCHLAVMHLFCCAPATLCHLPMVPCLASMHEATL